MVDLSMAMFKNQRVVEMNMVGKGHMTWIVRDT
jgi:hypothetical protein